MYYCIIISYDIYIMFIIDLYIIEYLPIPIILQINNYIGILVIALESEKCRI